MNFKKNTISWLVKVVFFITWLIFSAYAELSSQGAAVNTSGASAHPSAILDISSPDAGILIPRMTEVQKNSIFSPAEGLMIYQTDGAGGFWYFNGSTWVQSIGISGVTGATGPTGQDGTSGMLPPGTSAGNTPYWDGNQWVVNSSNIYNNGGSIGIGTSNPDASAAIEIFSTTKGALIPRMTTSERDAIVSPAQGLQIFNTTSNCFEFFLGPVWQIMTCGCYAAPTTVIQGAHIAQHTQITWNWSAVPGALGYKYNSVNNYSGATDNGSNTFFIQTGLTHNSSYNLYVWAYNLCGVSSASVLAQSTPFLCGSNVTFSYRGANVTYGTFSGQNSTCWLDRNLGATAVATSATHTAAYGHLFQWGRGDDGHQLRNSSTTTALSGSINPGHSNSIVINASPYDWLSAPNNTLWQGSGGTNSPCPIGFRLPIQSELNTERVNWATQNPAGAYGSSLKFTAAGRRDFNNGLLAVEGTSGCYWSSTVSGSNGASILFYSSGVNVGSHYRAYSFSVRCIKD